MMRKVLKSISMDGVVVIGEGEKDEVGAGEDALQCCTACIRVEPLPDM